MSILNLIFRKQPVERPQGDATSIAVSAAVERNAEAAKKLDRVLQEQIETMNKEERNKYASYR